MHTRRLILPFVAFLFSACGGDASDPTRVIGPLPIASIEITPGSDTLTAFGATVQFNTVVKDANGRILTGRPLAWIATDFGVALVNSTGLATAVSNGTTMIQVSGDGIMSSASLTVSQDIAAVEVTPSVDTLRAVGAVTQFTADVKDANSNPIADVIIVWSSGDPSVAMIDTMGVATSTGAGETTITALVRGVQGLAVLTVEPTAEPFFDSLSTGAGHGCGLTPAGGLFCWGENESGRLGDGTAIDRLTPVPVSGGLTFASAEAGGSNACGTTRSGDTYCWGWNSEGQVGDGTATDRLAPVLVAGGLSFTSVSPGTFHTCGITVGGDAYCWGAGGFGRLGDGIATSSLTPVLVSGGLSFASISAAGFHTCAITTGDDAYCWGDNAFGKLGDFTSIDRPAPVPVSGGLSFASVSAGPVHTCGITTGGDAYCWGRNQDGQLGSGAGDSPTPVLVPGGLSFVSVSLGNSHTCGTTTNGEAYCWGQNGFGQLGDGTETNHLTPALVSGGLNFASVAAGTWHTCGLTAVGQIGSVV